MKRLCFVKRFEGNIEDVPLKNMIKLNFLKERLEIHQSNFVVSKNLKGGAYE